MALWDRVRESASAMRARLTARRNHPGSGAFRDAASAMCAPVAAADGTVDPAERRRVAQSTATNEVPQTFHAAGLRRRFEENLAEPTAGFALGGVGVPQEIAKARKKPAEARAVVRIGIVIGGADGDFDKSEQAVVREACHALDLPPHEFDRYPWYRWVQPHIPSTVARRARLGEGVFDPRRDGGVHGALDQAVALRHAQVPGERLVADALGLVPQPAEAQGAVTEGLGDRERPLAGDVREDPPRQGVRTRRVRVGQGRELLGHRPVPQSLKSAFFHVSAHSPTVPE
ncbi:hypothetical protein GCM10010421_55880 [Streptomyces glaucus]|uniref:Co-chaperone DjlA N-terminal domain-containing protein n=1 Tax=Streptomyces glaucus TaxID=284029 RepID=A0ABN3KCB0_9ACTN